MKKITAMLLCLAMLLCMAACGSTATSTTAESAEAVSAADAATASEPSVAETEAAAEAAETEDVLPADAPESAVDDRAEEAAPVGTDVNIAVLAGPTGIGAAGLMEANDAGETVNHYNFTVASANDEVVAGLTSGEFDMAAIATNVAANLYAKTSGAIQICALNTRGVLYILENGDSVSSVADLAGRTVYATGQGANPEYVLEYILTQNGLTWSTDGSEADVAIEFMDSESLVAGMASGEYDLCMLPVPAVTSVEIQNADVRTALNLTEEWDQVAEDGQLVMGSVVVRREFAEEHPDAVAAFLEEYAASIDSVLADTAHAGELCESYGIVAKAAVATKAIPDCSLCCITGTEIRTALEPYYSVLFTANPDSIGGAIPDEDFYFVY